jgi:hypothetical protein
LHSAQPSPCRCGSPQKRHADTVCTDLLGGALIYGRCNTQRRAQWTERRLRDVEPAGAVASAVLEMWQQAFGKHESFPDEHGQRRVAPVSPPILALGVLYAQHKADMRLVQAQQPMVWVDGDSWRAARRFVLAQWRGQRRCADDEGAQEPVRMAQQGRELQIQALGATLTCPLQGKAMWCEPAVVSVQALASLPPWSLRGRVLPLVQGQHRLWLRQSELPRLDGTADQGTGA